MARSNGSLTLRNLPSLMEWIGVDSPRALLARWLLEVLLRRPDMNDRPDLLVTTFWDLLDALHEVVSSEEEVLAVLATMLAEGRVLGAMIAHAPPKIIPAE